MYKQLKQVAIGVCFVGVLLFGVAETVRAEGTITGANCTLRWAAGAGGGPVEGYRVFVGSSAGLKTQRAEVTGTSVPCSALNLTEGQWYVHIAAFNVAGASGASATVPFVLVLTAPSIPVNVTVER